MGAYALVLLVSVGEGATEDLWEGALDSSCVFWYEESMLYTIAAYSQKDREVGQPFPSSLECR